MYTNNKHHISSCNYSKYVQQALFSVALLCFICDNTFTLTNKTNGVIMKYEIVYRLPSGKLSSKKVFSELYKEFLIQLKDNRCEVISVEIIQRGEK